MSAPLLDACCVLQVVVGGRVGQPACAAPRGSAAPNPKTLDRTLTLAALHQVVVSDNRPALPPLERCPAQLADLMRRCWAGTPLDRPSAHQVAAELSAMMLEMGSGGGCSTA